MRKFLVFIINCRVNLLFLLSDFETDFAGDSVGFHCYDKKTYHLLSNECSCDS